MRFLSPFAGLLVGDGTMVIYLAARIKMAEGIEEGQTPAESRLLVPSFRGAERTRNLEIPGSALRASRNDNVISLSYPPSARQ
jgi:hypothetical protein